MNTHARDRGFEVRTLPARRAHVVPWLARLSGRDTEIQARTGQDVIREGEDLGRALLVSATLHGISMSVGLMLLAVPPAVAVGVAFVTASGLFAADRRAILSRDLGLAQAHLRAVAAVGHPAHVGWWGWMKPLPGALLRVAFSTVTAVTLAGALALHMFSADAQAVMQRRQIVRDVPFVHLAQGLLDQERQALDLERQRAEHGLAELARRADTVVERQRRIEADIPHLTARADDLRRAAQSARQEAARQREIARCELLPPTPGCSGASGDPRSGPRHRNAIAAAQASEARVAALNQELAAVVDDLAAATAARDRAVLAPLPPVPTGPSPVEQRLTAALKALAEFDLGRTARAAALVAANPQRQSIDPASLSERLSALGELARDRTFLIAMLAIKALALALELLAVIVAARLRPNEYHLFRGATLDGIERLVRNRRCRSHIDDGEIRKSLRRQLRAEADDEFADALFARSAQAGTAAPDRGQSRTPATLYRSQQ